MELKSALKKTPSEEVFEEQAPPVVEDTQTEAETEADTEEQTTQKAENNGAAQNKTPLVRFGAVNLRYYPITVGDNPCAKRGPPIQLDWKPIEQFVFPVDEYETNHERRAAFVLVSSKRMEMLREMGFAEAEIDKAIQIVREVKHLRATTIANLKRAWREEKAEERREFIRKLLTCKPEEVLDFPRVSVRKDEYWDENHKVQPMFDHIPCTHCSEMTCTGPGCDAPARVGMFRCDGKTCRQGGGINCPFTGKQIGGSKVATPTKE